MSAVRFWPTELCLTFRRSHLCSRFPFVCGKQTAGIHDSWWTAGCVLLQHLLLPLAGSFYPSPLNVSCHMILKDYSIISTCAFHCPVFYWLIRQPFSITAIIVRTIKCVFEICLWAYLPVFLILNNIIAKITTADTIASDSLHLRGWAIISSHFLLLKHVH